MADATSLELTPAHVPSAKAVSAFEKLSSRISQELVRSRKHWDAHEPRMYSRVADIPDAQFAQLGDLVAVRAGQTAYGTIVSLTQRITLTKPWEYEPLILSC